VLGLAEDASGVTVSTHEGDERATAVIVAAGRGPRGCCPSSHRCSPSRGRCRPGPDGRRPRHDRHACWYWDAGGSRRRSTASRRTRWQARATMRPSPAGFRRWDCTARASSWIPTSVPRRSASPTSSSCATRAAALPHGSLETWSRRPPASTPCRRRALPARHAARRPARALRRGPVGPRLQAVPGARRRARGPRPARSHGAAGRLPVAGALRDEGLSSRAPAEADEKHSQRSARVHDAPIGRKIAPGSHKTAAVAVENQEIGHAHTRETWQRVMEGHPEYSSPRDAGGVGRGRSALDSMLERHAGLKGIVEGCTARTRCCGRSPKRRRSSKRRSRSGRGSTACRTRNATPARIQREALESMGLALMRLVSGERRRTCPCIGNSCCPGHARGAGGP